jgi:hypothetical protein
MVRFCLTLGAVAVALAGFGALRLPAADEPKGHEHTQHMSSEMEKCLKECVRCAKECESCFQHCVGLVAQGKKEHVHTLRTCIDCADYCALAAKVISRHGAIVDPICDACAKACDTCGAACEKHPTDEHMKRCAEACKDCAKACRAMVKASGTATPRATSGQ